MGNFYQILIGHFISLSIQTFQPLITIWRRSNFIIIIGDVHHFFDHYLIPVCVQSNNVWSQLYDQESGCSPWSRPWRSVRRWLGQKPSSWWPSCAGTSSILENENLCWLGLMYRDAGDTSPQSFIMFKVYNRWLNNFGAFFWILIGGFIKLSVQIFQPLIVIN